ncbi:MAG TPA: hypothetical protein VFU60_01420 [Ktedonobacterales bacterium]|nr:hypothetical protein [Ktedonobacterales bacterium]
MQTQIIQDRLNLRRQPTRFGDEQGADQPNMGDLERTCRPASGFVIQEDEIGGTRYSQGKRGCLAEIERPIGLRQLISLLRLDMRNHKPGVVVDFVSSRINTCPTERQFVSHFFWNGDLGVQCAEQIEATNRRQIRYRTRVAHD